MKKVIKKGYKGEKITDTRTFIAKARWQHGDLYDYSETEYTKAGIKVLIICRKHGRFLQNPSDHTSKAAGCAKCKEGGTGDRCRKSTEDFIKESKEIHGDYYDYSKVEYISSKTPVCIGCPVHGEFYKIPQLHTKKGSGCRECYLNSIRKPKEDKENFFDKYTTEYFVERSNELHNWFHTYEKTEYKNNIEKVIITCPVHGDFLQKPNTHLLGSGCRECRKLKLRTLYQKTKEEFEKDAKSAHGEKYDYSKVEYTQNKTKVCIVCPDHGEFWQTPNNHLFAEYGCPLCAGKESGGWGKSNGFYKTNKPSNLYLIEMTGGDEKFLKVGLSKNVRTRHQCIEKESGYTIKVLKIDEGPARELYDVEYRILSEMGFQKYKPQNYFAGISECFSYREREEIEEEMGNVV